MLHMRRDAPTAEAQRSPRCDSDRRLEQAIDVEVYSTKSR